MGTYKRTEGQTLIETAIILFLLLLILLGITEFSRAWYTKSSLKNAARQGARVAVVTPNISDFSSSCTPTCPTSKPACTSTPASCNKQIEYTVCCESPGMAGLRQYTSVNLNVVEGAAATPGNTIEVRATLTRNDFFVVGGGIWPWPKSLNFTVDATMRYE